MLLGHYERQGWTEEGPPRVREWHGPRLVERRYAKRLEPAATEPAATEPA